MQGIYKLTFPDNKCYIGQSANLKRRLASYKHLKCQKQPAVYNALKQFGWDNVKVEIIEQFDVKEDLTDTLNALEIKYIKEYNCLHPNGYNLTSGGNKCSFSPEAKLKMRRRCFIRHWSVFQNYIFNYKVEDSNGVIYENAVECYAQNKNISFDFVYDLFNNKSEYHYIEDVESPFGDSMEDLDIDYYSDMQRVNNIRNAYAQRMSLDNKYVYNTLWSIIRHKQENTQTPRKTWDNLQKELVELANSGGITLIKESDIVDMEKIITDIMYLEKKNEIHNREIRELEKRIQKLI